MRRLFLRLLWGKAYHQGYGLGRREWQGDCPFAARGASAAWQQGWRDGYYAHWVED